jgi:DNA-binding protein HU-beta
LNRTQFIEAVANRAGLSVDQAGEVVQAMFDEVGLQLSQGKPLRLTGFGIFETRRRRRRTGRNPATGEPVKIPAMKVPHFRPGTQLREVTNGARKPSRAPRIRTRATAKHPAVVSRAARAS